MAENLPTRRTDLVEALSNPTRMRVAVTLVTVLLGYFAICVPLDEAIRRNQRLLRKAERRWQLAGDVEILRSRCAEFEPRLATDWDVNQWVQYTLDGVRARPLQLVDLDSRGTRKVGPFEAVQFQLRVSGEITDLDGLLNWLETNEHLFRVDSMKLEPTSGAGDRRQLTLVFSALQA